MDARVIPMVLAAGLATGCSQPKLSPSFESGIPTERTMAATRAVRERQTSMIPHLITMLESTDPAQRMIAADALRRLTGRTFGYVCADPEPRRREAAERWRAWHEAGASGSDPES